MLFACRKTDGPESSLRFPSDSMLQLLAVSALVLHPAPHSFQRPRALVMSASHASLPSFDDTEFLEALALHHLKQAFEVYPRPEGGRGSEGNGGGDKSRRSVRSSSSEGALLRLPRASFRLTCGLTMRSAPPRMQFLHSENPSPSSVLSASQWHSLPYAGGPAVSGAAAASGAAGTTLLFGGLSADRTASDAVWEFSGGMWARVELDGGSERPPPRMYSATAQLGEELYVFGGWDPAAKGSGGTFFDDACAQQSGHRRQTGRGPRPQTHTLAGEDVAAGCRAGRNTRSFLKKPGLRATQTWHTLPNHTAPRRRSFQVGAARKPHPCS